jgi:cytochrome c-type biogenesis protein CcsB
MHIREGEKSNVMVSDTRLFKVSVSKDGQTEQTEKEIYFSSLFRNNIKQSLMVGGNKVNVSLVKYLPVFRQDVVEDPQGKRILELKISSGKSGETYFISKGDTLMFDNFEVSYDNQTKGTKPTFLIKDKNGKLTMDFSSAIHTLKMDDKSIGELKAGTNPFVQRTLYQFDGNAIVLKTVHPKAKVVTKMTGLKNQSGKPELAVFNVNVEEKNELVSIITKKGEVGKPYHLTLNGVDIKLQVGPKTIQLPFEVKLLDFELERYPGSMTPSSYSSKVVLTDKENEIETPYHIYMNHVLDYRGYRFFQSSFDPDEKGTILSVNHDPGTLPTYIGYLLLTIGMFWNLFIPNGRFIQLIKKTQKLRQNTTILTMSLLLSFFSSNIQAKEVSITPEQVKQTSVYDVNHANAFGKLVVQDPKGRMKPMDTLSHEVVAKITGKSSVFGQTPNQTILGMTINPNLYQTLPLIKIGHPKIAVSIGLDKNTKYARFTDFFDEATKQYKLTDAINEAVRKRTLDKSQYDKKLIEIDERLNICYMVYSGNLLQIFPKPNDKNNKWLSPVEAMKTFNSDEGKMIRTLITNYFGNVELATQSGDWKRADNGLAIISMFQHKFGAKVIPSDIHINLEIQYNALGVFGKLIPVYLILGIGLLFFSFIHILKPSFSLKWIMLGTLFLLSIAFVTHIVGLGMRWYIAGHAPWSNAYESIVFIALTTILAGLLLARKSPIALAGATTLAGITMGVAHMNFINPEITNLVPVLKSYWLMIHVATIIAGDGFLGLGFILSLLVLILFVFKTKSNQQSIENSISELTNLSEMGLIIGLVLMTVGNFLGGVWANESWGRYWGWDPKETWAAVTILVYAAVLHLRFIPALNTTYIFNVASVWAYSTVLMTYFGVNYYLSGLHSYAAGDPVPIPMWVYYMVGGLVVLTLLAGKNRKLNHSSIL